MGNMAQEAAAKGMIQYQIDGKMDQYVSINGISFYAPINSESRSIRTSFPFFPRIKNEFYVSSKPISSTAL